MTRTKTIISALALTISLGSYLALAQQPAPQAPQQPPMPMTFFVTSIGLGKGADLGGIAGADRHCQALAAATGPAGNKTWHAYMSTSASGGQPAVNARERIGQGPWFNQRGVQIAKNLSDLHGDTLDSARLGNNINKQTSLTEKGEIVNGAGDPQTKHDMLTGSQTDGKAYTDNADHTCGNWTSSTTGTAQLGHTDRTGGGNTSWNSTHPSRGCSQEGLVSTGGAGLFYCFAIN
jgi:hypothetical protein